MGRRFHLRLNLGWGGVHRVRHRRVLTANRRVAHREPDANRTPARRVRDGVMDPG